MNNTSVRVHIDEYGTIERVSVFQGGTWVAKDWEYQYEPLNDDPSGHVDFDAMDDAEKVSQWFETERQGR